MTTFGEVTYNDDIGGNEKKTSGKDLWLRLKEGPNEVRLVTAPFQYQIHKYKKDPNNTKDFGEKVGCSIVHGSCQLCEAGDTPKSRWFYGVIDRETQTYKILDVSYAVFSQIRKLARNPKIGDPTKYDINIEVDKKAPPPQYYTVQNLGKEPLSATDQQLKDNADLDFLKSKCNPPTLEQVQRRLDKINGVATTAIPVNTAKKATPAKPVVKAAEPVVEATDEEKLEETFPSYDGAQA